MILDPITNRVVQILTIDKDVFVPVRRLYQMLTGEGLLTCVDVESFIMLLEADERFEFVDDLEDEVLGWLLDAESNVELSAVGFFNGPRVRLRAREITSVMIMDSLLRQLQRMNSSLEIAWREISDDPESEAALLHVLMMGDMLERQVLQMLEEELVADDYMESFHSISLDLDDFSVY